MNMRKKLLGEKHPHTLLSMGNLAVTYSNQGRWNEAEQLEVQVMNMRKELLGEEHPDTLLSMGNLAVTYSNQGRWNEAELPLVQLMNMRETLLGEKHSEIFQAAWVLNITKIKHGIRQINHSFKSWIQKKIAVV